MDFAGQEQRFGPLVNPQGMNLDDAAMRAWEAGYFPELRDRPDVNTFLDALRDTYNGTGRRRFLPEDQPEAERFYATQGERYDFEQRRFETGQPMFQDRSAPAGEQPFPPVQAYEEWPAGGRTSPGTSGSRNWNRRRTSGARSLPSMPVSVSTTPLADE